ncbi:MAG: hypothetical protein OEZ52_00645 [Candidatus Aminicenantes bacterium]|nr:hypothetical protein [Candidatus Aminicenantes bacterium]MDH5742031.1 hypothetical protein [Candidatus Aminicenantes bacterium]
MHKGIVRPTGGRGIQIIIHAAQSTQTDKGRKIILVALLEQGTNSVLAVVRCSFSGIKQPDIQLYS